MQATILNLIIYVANSSFAYYHMAYDKLIQTKGMTMNPKPSPLSGLYPTHVLSLCPFFHRVMEGMGEEEAEAMWPEGGTAGGGEVAGEDKATGEEDSVNNNLNNHNARENAPGEEMGGKAREVIRRRGSTGKDRNDEVTVQPRLCPASDDRKSSSSKCRIP
jgi:hypothetical protein